MVYDRIAEAVIEGCGSDHLIANKASLFEKGGLEGLENPPQSPFQERGRENNELL